MAGLPEPGAEWAGFRIEQEIGEGGFGRVYAAWDPVLERRVALKILAPESSSGEVDPAVRERFLRESRTAAGLDHPRIVPIHTASEHEGVPYLVMRFVDGGDLRSELGQGPLSLARTVRVVEQVADALDRAHRGGLVHRDVKPANILCVADSEDVYLTDFGITREMRQSTDAALTRTGQMPASPHYASPEQLTGEAELGPATDVYSLGCTAFECLTGRVPFPGRNHLDVGHQHLHADRPAVTAHRPDLPAALDGVLATAMAVDPADRYGSCAELAAALAAVRDGTAPPPGTPPVVPPVATDPVGTAAVSAGQAAEPGRSVFDRQAGGIPWSEPTTISEAAGDDTRVVPVGGSAVADGRRVVEVEWDDPDEDRPRSRAPWIVAGALFVAVLAVAGLVLWAVNSDAELDTATATTTTSVPPAVGGPPTVEQLRTLIPAELTTCVPPADAAEVDDRAQLVCPRDSVPELVTFTLFTDGEARQAAFVDAVTTLELDPGAQGECALADDVVHAYVGTNGQGQIACRTEGSRVDLVWTRGDVPLLATAGGNGFYGAYYRFWSDLVERSDDAFPLPIEADLLADLPVDLLDRCRRDVDLTAEAPGIAAVVCEPEDAEPDAVSWVQFADSDTMDAWIEQRLASLGEDVRTDTRDDACTSKGFGDRRDDEDDEEPASPVVGFTDYEEDGTSGQVLCFVNTSGQNVLFWTRDEHRVGSIAVSGTREGDMEDLLKWWEKDGHLP